VVRISGLLAAAVAGMSLAAGITGCGRGTPQRTTVAPPSVAAPLATSVQAAGGTWATLPMGHLGDPANTFWQLLYRAAGASSWSDRVEATATATNGGLVLASAAGRSLLVGVRPSNRLNFSPVIATSDGHAWTNGLTGALASRPAALAAGRSGQALALVTTGSTTAVEASPGDLAGWQTLATRPQLAATTSGQACDPVALGAVGYAGASPVIGARCARPGVVGLFATRGGGWHLAAAITPPPPAGARVDVLSLQPTASGLTALLAAAGASETTLLAAWSEHGGVDWALSPALPLSAGQRLSSLGPAGGEGQFALITSSSGAEQLDVVNGPGASWRPLPAPPAGTATVAWAPAPQALVADNTVLTVWTLEPASSAWVKAQTINVPIQFGSSS
jgi:hypothetical protein